MVGALIRRSLGLWLGVIAAGLAWAVVGLVMTVVALAVALGLSLIGRALRRVRRDRAAPGRPRIDLLSAPMAGVLWSLAVATVVAAPAARAIPTVHVLHRLGDDPAGLAHVASPWGIVLDLFVGAALVSSILVARALRRPDELHGERSYAAFDRARAIVTDHGADSLSSYILRPDKELQFAGDGVVAFAVVGETVVISADPVGPRDSAAQALAALVARAHRAGLRVAAYGASDRYLDVFGGLGMRAVRAGEEAVVDPRAFTLEGRSVRKLRQSVHRVDRLGWRVAVCEAREIDGDLEAAIDANERRWRAQCPRILGFAMSMGEFEPSIGPDDVYALAWSPQGHLQGVVRFIAHRGRLSLDTMRRVGETPNGMVEALVCHALQFAAARGIEEVSLNYAGLSHLLRADAPGSRPARAIAPLLLGPLRSRFQMDRLVRFNQKFSPCWRPRYLVFESPVGLPRALLRVLQAEGHLPRPATRIERRNGPRPATVSAALKQRFGG